MEWLTWMNSTEKQPARITSPAFTTFSGATPVRRCSFSLCSHSASVSRVP